MDKILDFIEKNVKTIIAIALAVLFLTCVVPLFINWAFNKSAIFPFFDVDWEASDALGYYGDVLGFLGTVIFSGLALWQNHVIQEANNQHTILLEKMERQKNAPHLMVKAVSANGNASNLGVKVFNVSDNIAENLRVFDFAIIDENDIVLWKNNTVQTVEYLKSNSEWIVNFGNPQIMKDTHRVIFALKFCDTFGEEYAYRAVGIPDGRTRFPKIRIKQV